MDYRKIFLHFIVSHIKPRKKDKSITIKRQLFLSNIRMVVISVIAFGLFGQLFIYILRGSGKFDWEAMVYFIESSRHNFRMIMVFLSSTFFMVLVSIINSIFTHRITKKIIKPLEPLSEGVRQIQANNFAYRIHYQNNDEFRPVCDAFNAMAEKLELSTAQLKKDETSRKELIMGISHDLNTPLTSVIGCIEGIETGITSTPEKKMQYLGFIKNESIRMKHIIEQLFLFSKLDMDEFPLNLRNIDISITLYEMIEDSFTRYENRGLSIHFAQMPKDIIVNVDVYLLHNTIINILENSVKYKTKKHGNMEICATVLNNTIELRFTDDGPGVEEEALEKLLEVFYRSDPSRSKTGSGLGLAISAKIITRMGGAVHAELPDSEGLAIVIQLPIIQGTSNEC